MLLVQQDGLYKKVQNNAPLFSRFQIMNYLKRQNNAFFNCAFVFEIII